MTASAEDAAFLLPKLRVSFGFEVRIRTATNPSARRHADVSAE